MPEKLAWLAHWFADSLKSLEHRVLPLFISTRRRHRYRQANPSFAYVKTLGFALGGFLVVLLSVGLFISQSSQHWVSAEGTLDDASSSNHSTAQPALSAIDPAVHAHLKRLGAINSVDVLQQKSWENGLALLETLSKADDLMAQHGRNQSTMRQDEKKQYQSSLNQQIAVIENLMAERKALLSLAKRNHVNTLYTPMVQSQLQQTLDKLSHNGATLPPQWHQWKTLLSDADESSTSPTL